MKHFLNRNKQKLIENFEREVMDHNDNGSRDINTAMFELFAINEAQNNAHRYENLSADNPSTESSPERQVPPDRPPLEWDYKPTMPEPVPEPNNEVPNNTRQRTPEEERQLMEYYERLFKGLPLPSIPGGYNLRNFSGK